MGQVVARVILTTALWSWRSHILFLLIRRLQKSCLGPSSCSSRPDPFDFKGGALPATGSCLQEYEEGTRIWGSFQAPVSLYLSAPGIMGGHPGNQRYTPEK